MSNTIADAAEGQYAQTKFVLSKALFQGLETNSCG